MVEAIYSNIQGSQFRLLHTDSDTELKIVRDFGNDSDVYQKIIEVRQNAGDRQLEFEFDQYSSHYCLLHRNRPVGSMTATRPGDGFVDCASAYPTELMRAFEDLIFTTCKFRINRNDHSSLRTLREMTRQVWNDQIDLGSRMVLMNAEASFLPFYRRMGFLVVADSSFAHPTLGTASKVMVMPSDPRCRTFFTDLFEDIVDNILLDDVLSYCKVEPSGGPNRRNKKLEVV